MLQLRRARATIRKTGSAKTISASWRFGLKYVNVGPGTYKVSIRATCSGAAAVKNSTVTVRKEKDSNTVTRSEFNRIKTGMTLDQVKRIVGTGGIGDSDNRYLDRTGGFGWTQLWLERGRVGGKLWNVGRGDGGIR